MTDSQIWPFNLPGSGNDAISLSTGDLDQSLFREYDIRGRVNDGRLGDVYPLNEFSANRIGRAFGSLLVDQGISEVVVGYDARSYSEMLANAVTVGLLSTGVDVVFLGLATTPLVYFAQHELGGTAGICVTASHNPNGWSGFKLSNRPSVTLGPEEIAEVADRAAKGNFSRGQGRYREQSLTEAYANYIASALPAPRPLKVAIDGGNSIAGPIAELALKGAGYDVITLNRELDWTFPNHEPDPESTASRAQIQEAVVKHGAHCGISFDGDGDRLGVTDGAGNIVWADAILALLAEEVLRRRPGAPIVYDVKCSRMVTEVIERAGGTPVMTKTGHSHIKSKMRDVKAPFAGERSGHFFFADGYLGYDDAIYAALRLLSVIGADQRDFATIVADLPHYEGTPTMHAECADSDKYRVVEDFARYAESLNPREIVRINGVRVEFDDGWLLVRASSNMPALVILAEANSGSRLFELYQMLRTGLSRSPEVASDWLNDPWK
ncbi:phosphoglucomutase [Actinoallomurus iriomotensis]|uniref:Phosphoglucomutase n=1 Tax=Actinoallomurus iriomotensis TaxID=478107 RepID=A0A9W6VXM7_9ACTN|nr:phosphoglucomutase [Actinoallomurus iriomotensis]